MSENYLTTLNYTFSTEKACETVVERLEAQNASFEAMSCSDSVKVGEMEVPYPTVEINGVEYAPSQIKDSPEFQTLLTSFGGNGKAFDPELMEDTPTVEYGKKPYFKFDFGKVEQFVNTDFSFLPESVPQTVRNQWFFYARRLILLAEIKSGLEAKKDG